MYTINRLYNNKSLYHTMTLVTKFNTVKTANQMIQIQPLHHFTNLRPLVLYPCLHQEVEGYVPLPQQRHLQLPVNLHHHHLAVVSVDLKPHPPPPTLHPNTNAPLDPRNPRLIVQLELSLAYLLV